MGGFWYQSYLLVLLSFAFANLAHSSLEQQQLCLNQEKLALLQFKQRFLINCDITSDRASAYPKVESWGNGTEDCCMWDGVECNHDTGRVIRLDVSNSCLYGNFPAKSTLFNLRYLESLNLAANHFNYSEIPRALGQLDKLTNLDLSSSFFGAQIPSEISKLSNLNIVDLSNNLYQFDDSKGLFGIVDLSNNLYQFDNSKGLFGNFDTFLMLDKLTILDLSGVNLIFPSNTSILTSSSVKLNVLGLHSCNLTKFPDFLRHQNELKYLSLSKNNIQGNIPQWLLHVAKESLSLLDLSYNSLTGFEQPVLDLPWKFLEDLDLSNNKLQGPLPNPSYSMVVYKVSNNSLTGVIPEKICNARSLKVLDLSGNKMSGPIPICLGNQLTQSLLVLNLRGNNFSGIIPQTSNKSCTMKMINLSENQLEGNLPRSLASCKTLEVLDIGRNNINDSFPSWLGSLPNLQVLVLRHNNFHGVIARRTRNGFVFPSLRIIDLSSNFFSGDFPSGYFQHWDSMKWSIDEQQHSGSSGKKVTVTILISGEPFVRDEGYTYSINIMYKGNEMLIPRILNVFRVIDFSSNKFTGRIPDSIGKLSGLEAVNLSNNNLEGGIPSTLANMKELESLDLSQNMLSGQIPQELVLITSLAVFNVSHNNLVGPIPQGAQFNTFDNTSFDGNTGLCGNPLSRKCGNVDEAQGLQPSLVTNDEGDEDELELVDWIIRMLGCASGFVVCFILTKLYITDKNHEWFVDTFGKRKSKRKARRAPKRRS